MASCQSKLVQVVSSDGEVDKYIKKEMNFPQHLRNYWLQIKLKRLIWKDDKFLNDFSVSSDTNTALSSDK